MKYVALLVLLLGFTVPVYAVGLNGKGLFCPDANEGYWFKDGIAIRWFIQGSSLKTVSQNYYEAGQFIVSRVCTPTYDPKFEDDCTFVFLDRRTLVFKPSGQMCELVNYSEELVQKLQDQIDAAKAENKI
tara:strand:- start:150 stop:539 length:390 start_codon:yes stop_codon:yes gene_type:complete